MRATPEGFRLSFYAPDLVSEGHTVLCALESISPDADITRTMRHDPRDENAKRLDAIKVPENERPDFIIPYEEQELVSLVVRIYASPGNIALRQKAIHDSYDYNNPTHIDDALEEFRDLNEELRHIEGLLALVAEVDWKN